MGNGDNDEDGRAGSVSEDVGVWGGRGGGQMGSSGVGIDGGMILVRLG